MKIVGVSCLVGVLLNVCLPADALGTYTVVAPKVIRPGLAYQVSVSVHDTLQPVRLSVTISGKGTGGHSYVQTNEALISSGETQILKFEVGEWGPGKYNLTASGHGGLDFSNTTQIEYQHKSYSVFIQTDKAIYKPGEVVHFRAVVVNPMLRPSVSGAIEVYLTDGQGNRIKQWKRVFTTKGIFSGDVKLSDQPVLGDWNITVNVLDQLFTKSFTVAEYVLPTYEVSVRLPPYAVFNDTNVVATVTAMYTYGKPVKGDVTLVMSPRVHSQIIQVWLTPPTRKSAPIDGIADIPIDLADFHLQEDYQRDIKIEAIVKEELTGQRQNNTAILSLYRHRIKLELIQTAETFKPGLKFEAYLKVAYQDDVPVQDAKNKVKVKFGYNHDESSHQTDEYSIPSNGIIPLTFTPPNTPETNVLLIAAEYLDVKQYFPGVERSLSPSNNYIQAILQSKNPRVKDEVDVEVSATEPLTSFVFQVVGRGDLVLSQTVHVNNERKSRFKVLITSPMAPKARLIVYYVRQDGEVVADSLTFDVEGLFQTPVSVTTSTGQALPGSQVEVRVNTRPHALACLLGVDQKVLLLKGGNDITQKDVLEELQTYDSGRKPPLYSDMYLRYLWSTGSVTASKVFEDSGVIIITNGNVFQHYPRTYDIPTGRAVGSDFVDYEPRLRLYQRFGSVEPTATTVQPNSIQERISDFALPAEKRKLNTWLWAEARTGGDGTAVVTSTIPDSITSWVISAFAMDTLTGLGVVETPAKLTVFRPFFISLNLPYSIIRGEAVGIQVIVFNYMQKDVTASVTLKNSGQFDFLSFETSSNEIRSPTSQKQKRVMVRAGDGASLTFMIIPNVLGYLDIDVSAQTGNAGDRVIKKLLVKPEGSPLHFNKAVLVDLRQRSNFLTNIDVDIPKYAVPGSQHVEVSAIADILGPTVNNLDKLLRMPFGCGEQNMLNFVPNIVVAEYLTRIGQVTENMKQKITTFLETGYQRELTYKHKDGSFSAFGAQDKSGSTWLTAFVAKSFHQAKPYVTIDDSVIQQSLRWLASKQSNDGSFPEVGIVNHKAMQGGSSGGVALTAYVLIAFLENSAQNFPEFAGVVQKAIDKLDLAVLTLDEVYPLSVVTYALNLANSTQRTTAFNRLTQKAKLKGEVKFWTHTKLEPEADDPSKPSKENNLDSLDIETTSYSLLTHVLRQEIETSLQIAKWLVSQRNENGGFASTQDTVIGIQALAALAQSISIPNTNIEIGFTFKNATKAITLSTENSMILHKMTLFSDTRQVSISARGTGFAIVQVTYSYNLNVTKEAPAFSINPLVDRNSNKNLLVINACTSYAEPGGTSNMAVMEVQLPSGYTVDKDSLPALLNLNNIKRVESKDGESVVVIYFDKLDNEDVCPTVKAYRTFKVAKQKPAAVRVYDYYNLGRSARSFYQPLSANLCDICEGQDCAAGSCRPENDRRGNTGDIDVSDAAIAIETSAIAVMFLTIVAVLLH